MTEPADDPGDATPARSSERHEKKTRPNVPQTGVYTPDELREIGIKSLGDDVRIDRSVRFFGADRISIGSHVRIDAYSVLSAGSIGLNLGSHVHLATGVRFLGGDQVTLEDFCGLSAGVCVFGSNEDYSGGALTNPTVPDSFRRVTTEPVVMKKHAIIGANSVIMPGVILGVGASVGALTFVNKSVPDFCIVSGNPMRQVGKRSASILDRERHFREQAATSPGKRES